MLFRRVILFNLLSILIMTKSFAQIEWNGVLDFAASMSGKNSTFVGNGIANEYRLTHLSIDQFNLILYAPVDLEMSVEAGIRIDSWGTGKLNQPSLSFAVLNYAPIEKRSSWSIGRFVTPFGNFHQRQFAFNRSFVTSPLAYSYFVNLSDKRGIWPEAGDNGAYGVDDVGTTALGLEGLSTGILYINKTEYQGSNVQFAITNSTPSSIEKWTNQFGLAFTGRFGWWQTEKWEQGISITWGSYMSKDESISPNLPNTEKYKQTALGTDWNYQSGLITINGEIIWSRWSAPRFDNLTGGFAFDLDNPDQVKTVIPSLVTGYIDIIYNFIFIDNLYFAARAETMKFSKLNDPLKANLSGWDRDISRFSFGFGKPINEAVHFKFSYCNQMQSNVETDLKDWSIRSVLTVMF
jgi:hypothetical protein